MPYVPNTDMDREEMLRAIGLSSVDELFDDVPEGLRYEGALDVPGPLSEQELVRHMSELSRMNKTADDVVSFLGGGVYDALRALRRRARHRHARVLHGLHALPGGGEPGNAAGDLRVPDADREPHRHGRRQRVALRRRHRRRRGRPHGRRRHRQTTRSSSRSSAVDPEYRACSRTYLVVDGLDGRRGSARRRRPTDLDALASALERRRGVVVQHPNFFGCLEAVAAIVGGGARAPARCSSSVVDPMSLAMLKPPGEYGADIAVGEGQSLGVADGLRRAVPRVLATSREARAQDARADRRRDRGRRGPARLTS